jgi:hypothetical protein
MGAGPRRAFVYLIAAALVVAAGMIAARLSMPADPYGSVRVQHLSEGASRPGARTEQVQWDSEQGRGVVDVREGDGVIRRYFMESDGGDGMRVWGGDEVQTPEGEVQ